MLIAKLYEGLTSEFRNFIIAYRFSVRYSDELQFDLSDFYNGSFWSYHLDYMNFPNFEKIFFRGNAVLCLKKMYSKNVIVIENGSDMEKVYNNYDNNNVYYICNDSWYYDSFLEKHNEFFYRYIGNDTITKNIYRYFELTNYSPKYYSILNEILNNEESVAVHIRLGDFKRLGWIMENDYVYYKAAIEWFREKMSNPKFYIFSDDLNEAKNILGKASDLSYVCLNNGFTSDIEEVICLSCCKNKILSKKSTFGLLSVAIANNKFGISGINVILKYQHFSDNASNKDYLEKNFNNNLNNKLHSNKWLGNYVELGLDKIRQYSNKYKKISDVNINTKKKIKYRKTDYVLFITHQTYSKSVPKGMQYLAHYFAMKDFSVGFVGNDIQMDDGIVDSIKWTIDNLIVEKGQNSFVSDIETFPYRALNINNNYLEFVTELKAKKNKERMIIINRKVSALPKGKHNDYFIFLDFTDAYDAESVKCNIKYTQDEIISLYEGSDAIITFDKDVVEKYSHKKVYYVDVKKFFPDMILINKKMSAIEIRSYQDNYSNEIMKVLFKVRSDILNENQHNSTCI